MTAGGSFSSRAGEVFRAGAGARIERELSRLSGAMPGPIDRGQNSVEVKVPWI